MIQTLRLTAGGLVIRSVTPGGIRPGMMLPGPYFITVLVVLP